MKFQKVADRVFAVRLEKGDEIVSSLSEFTETNLDGKSARLSGIGALEKATLGFYNLENGEYVKKEFNEESELLHCTGNISYRNEAPMVHLHTILGRIDFSTVGGHLFDGTISVTGEFLVEVLDGRIERAPGTGFAPWGI